MANFTSTPDPDDARLDALFREYREICFAPEPSAGFMPQLWERIEARQSVSLLFGRWAKSFVTIAVSLSLFMGVYVALPHPQSSPFYAESYVEALAASHAAENADFFEPVNLDLDAGTVADEEL